MRSSLLNPLFSPVECLAGVGARTAKALSGLLDTPEDMPPRVIDLLFHLPVSVVDRSYRPSVAEIAAEGTVTLDLCIDRHMPPPAHAVNVPYRIRAGDDSGGIDIVFFRGEARWLEKQFPVGERRIVSGRVTFFQGRPQMNHPDYVVPPEETDGIPWLEPVYPLTKGISGKMLGRYMQEALAAIPDLPEWHSIFITEKNAWPSFRDALHLVHRPAEPGDTAPLSPARMRLAADELLAGQLALAAMRSGPHGGSGVAHRGDGRITGKIVSALPFPLTGAQENAVREIWADMAAPSRMYRLLQGDVGSGKTIVALLAAARAVESGAQAALMAPTAILARQHAASLGPVAAAAGMQSGLLTGRDGVAARRDTLARLASGEINILVGTHAIFQDDVKFHNLGLAIMDEQHRFGVEQRMRLSGKGADADILVMTATPIPRTLVLAAFGDLDVSRILEKPPGRKPVKTAAVPAERIDGVIERLRNAVAGGARAYWVCPLIEEGGESGLTAAEQRQEMLASRFGNAVGLVHGRMKETERDQAMDAFREGATRILVATTAVEVGLDVPEATIMIVEHAERFGLSQLHQLRGRVGRGGREGSCLLVYTPPLGAMGRERLAVMRETDDGFRIAETDLRLRGEGDVLGSRQSGMPDFRLARLELHGMVLEEMREEAWQLAEAGPALAGGTWGEAIQMLLHLFGRDGGISLA